MAYNGTQSRRIAAGLCIACGGPKSEDSSRLICAACAAKRSHREHKVRLGRHSTQSCITCGAPRQPGQSKCATCQERDAGYRADMRKRWGNAGLCAGCGQQPPLDTLPADAQFRVCERCYFRYTSKARFGTMKHWRALQDKLINQNYTCPYTGVRLVLGVNDSVDHIYPVARFPERKNDLSNIEWVCREVNEMKRDRTPEEFLSLIACILAYRSQQARQAST